MDYSTNSLVTINDIMANVKMFINDEDSKMFSSGWYKDQAQQALSKLSFETVFFKIVSDVDFPSENLTLPIPKGCFNIRELYIYNTNDDCEISDLHEVYWKRNYRPKGDDKGYTARMQPLNKGSEIENVDWYNQVGTDVYNPKYVVNENNIYYYNSENGYIFLSSTCKDFDKVRIVYNGVFTNIGDTPVVPEMFREAVQDYIMEVCFQVLKARNPKFYRPLWNDKYQTLYGKGGTWGEAKRRAKNLDFKKLKDLLEYQAKMNY